MRSGRDVVRWVRPLKSILCLFGSRTVPLSLDLGGRALEAGNVTYGHRFMAPDAIEVFNFTEYRQKLDDAFVVLDAADRRTLIWDKAKALAEAASLELVEDKALLDEVAGLVENPVPLLGQIDARFMDLPPEVLTTSMRTHQKYFALTDKATGRMAPNFLVVANLAAQDGGKAIVNGNERVLRARLADAEFFWTQDRRDKLEAGLPQLADIVFHEKIGTLEERVENLILWSEELAMALGGEAQTAARAARLCKADLVTGMVGEFPELQGLMGSYYARADGEVDAVADAIRDHYKPQGPADSLPEGVSGAAVALADKFDVLTLFWRIDEKPTGSKDPFALRRAALGAIRIILENTYRLRLIGLFDRHMRRFGTEFDVVQFSGEEVVQEAVDLLSFIADRLKVYLRDRGARHDLVDAVFSLPGQDDLVLIVERIEALSSFLETADGTNLLAAYKRAANILRIEEKKDGRAYSDDPSTDLLAEEAERELFEAILLMQPQAAKAVGAEDFGAAMGALAQLRAPVDRFFDEVTVNADDPELRANRLKLLSLIRRAMTAIADFSKIEG